MLSPLVRNEVAITTKLKLEISQQMAGANIYGAVGSANTHLYRMAEHTSHILYLICMGNYAERKNPLKRLKDSGVSGRGSFSRKE